MARELSPWSMPRKRLLEALRGMARGEASRGTDILILAASAAAFIVLILLL